MLACEHIRVTATHLHELGEELANLAQVHRMIMQDIVLGGGLVDRACRGPLVVVVSSGVLSSLHGKSVRLYIQGSVGVSTEKINESPFVWTYGKVIRTTRQTPASPATEVARDSRTRTMPSP
jgi:hypothetical protein